MPTEIDSNGNYAPVLRHPDPPASATFLVASTNDVIYESTDPTTEGLTPPDPSLPSEAYKRNGMGTTYVWDTIAHTWG